MSLVDDLDRCQRRYASNGSDAGTSGSHKSFRKSADRCSPVEWNSRQFARWAAMSASDYYSSDNSGPYILPRFRHKASARSSAFENPPSHSRNCWRNWPYKQIAIRKGGNVLATAWSSYAGMNIVGSAASRKDESNRYRRRSREVTSCCPRIRCTAMRRSDRSTPASYFFSRLVEPPLCPNAKPHRRHHAPT